MDIVTRKLEKSKSGTRKRISLCIICGLGTVALLIPATDVYACNLYFKPPVSYATGDLPQSVAVADLNQDGKPDLVTANQGIADPSTGRRAGTVSVLLGNGNGTFRSAVDFAAGVAAQEIKVADLNRDDKPDLIVTNNGLRVGYGQERKEASVSILLGNGDGTFQTRTNYPEGSGYYNGGPWSTAVGDFNRDGALDLVTTRAGELGTISVRLGTGNGTFKPNVVYPTDMGPKAVVAADLNRDAKLDLVIALHTCQFAVMLGNGDGTFQPGVGYPVCDGVGAPTDVSLADFNRDGKIDVAVNGLSARQVGIVLGNGDGTLSPDTHYYEAGDPTFGGLAVADLNRDGRLDLLTPNTWFDALDGTVAILLGNGDGTLRPKVETENLLGGMVSDVQVADFNRDGKPDLVTTMNPIYTGGTVTVLLSGRP